MILHVFDCCSVEILHRIGSLFKCSMTLDYSSPLSRVPRLPSSMNLLWYIYITFLAAVGI